MRCAGCNDVERVKAIKTDSNYVSHLGFFFLEHNLAFHHNGRKCCIIVVTSLDRAQGACFLMHSGCIDRAHDWGPGGQVQVLTGTLWIVSTDEGRDWKADLHSYSISHAHYMYSRLAHNLRVRLHADEVCRMQWRRKGESYKNWQQLRISSRVFFSRTQSRVSS